MKISTIVTSFCFGLLFFALTGCAGAYNQTRNQLDMAAKQELAAWAEVQNLYQTQCPVSSPEKPLPHEKAIESNKCYESLVSKHVMPVAMDTTEVSKYLLANQRTAIDYKKGKLDRDEAKLQIQQNWTDYVARVDAKGDVVLNAAAQRDAQLAQQRQQYFQDLSKQINQAETQRAIAAEQSGPTNTNCNFIGNQMQCTTW